MTNENNFCVSIHERSALVDVIIKSYNIVFQQLWVLLLCLYMTMLILSNLKKLVDAD